MSARNAIWHAWFVNDTARLRLLLPEALAAGQDDGSGQRWSDRAQTLMEAKAFAASGGTLTKLEFPRTEIHVMGDVAVVFSIFSLEIRTRDARHPMTGRSTEVFVLRNGRWVNPFWHLGA